LSEQEPDHGTTPVMPAIYLGHGSPMNAIEDNAFSQAWRRLGEQLPKPRAVLCISAHWETQGTYVTATERPRTIHDFYGFPPALYAVQYPCPGDPDLAQHVCELLRDVDAGLDHHWGLDHGAWSVLRRLAPDAGVPVLQLSLDRTLPPAGHYDLARALGVLRERGVLILGSGNIVHNLGLMRLDGEPYPWAEAFDVWARDQVLGGAHGALIDYQQCGPSAHLAVPTNEHYLPLLYVLAVQRDGEDVAFLCEQVVYGSVSMRALLIG
jgi:4,5-DOPA dioxygenase extradiol